MKPIDPIVKKHARFPDDPFLSPRWIKLKDGHDYLLRPLHPDDEELLQTFFKSHTEDTIHDRYGYLITTMTWKRAHELVAVDQTRDPALAILTVTRQGAETIHAVGRYFLNPASNSAEMAFVVGESKRRLGMASILLDQLTAIASSRKVEKLWALVLPSNSGMLTILRNHGFVIVRRELDEVFLEKCLTGTSPPASGSKPV